jgi:hypothetical protein
MDWIDLGQDTDRQWVFVSTVMNLRVPQNSEDFPTKLRTCQLLKKGFCSMELVRVS